MKLLIKIFPKLLILLTLLFIGYFTALALNHDKPFYYNEEWGFYIILQIVHVIVSVLALLMIWASKKFDKWQKIDQVILVIFLSIFGLWIWYFKHYRFYINELTIDEYLNQDK